MKTRSIIDILETKFGYKDSYTEEECNQIESLVINRFGIGEDLIEVEVYDLLNFKNLKSLTISQCMLDVKTLSVVSTLKKLETLILLNCDVVDDIYDIFSSLNIKALIIDDTDIDLGILTDFDFEELILSNVEIPSNIKFNAYKLDIRKSKYENLNLDSVQKLVISYSQYISNKNYFDNNKEKLIIMEDNGQFVYSGEGL